METNNTRLLWSKDKLSINDGVFDFDGIWERLNTEYKEITKTIEDDRVLSMSIDIEKLVSKYKVIQFVCGLLLDTGEDSELIEILETHGYTVTGDFKACVEGILKKSESTLRKAKRIMSKLPEKEEIKDYPTIEDVITSHSVITGLTPNYNETVTEFLANKKQANNKIKALEKNG